ncbi:hypothetical protein AMTR_s00006p00248320 [Amborella trichopoda]|uniref:Uncharacterized protein n=1 Tax=Amborella trichopoda TaxID=13333 RepID=W1PDH0_AMBTC|nr:hypothetical protein AMTR_s00006p00248320 [Amborella trichopoda]
MAQDAMDDLGDTVMVLEDDLNMALVTSDQHPPISTISLEQRPLLRHFTFEPPKEVSVDVVAVKEMSVDEIVVKEAPIDPDEIISNNKLEKLEAIAQEKLKQYEKEKGVGLQSEKAAPKTPQATAAKAKGRGTVIGSWTYAPECFNATCGNCKRSSD